MQRPNETIYDYALRRTWLLIKSDIPSKYVVALKNYIDQLSKDDVAIYINIANNLYDRRTLGARSIKVTLNAIKLCVKLAQFGYLTFPYIEKIATKGWSTSGGTYSFSIKTLSDVGKELFSYEPANLIVKNGTRISVDYNEHTRCTEINFV
jgi:hypothetical protein